MKWGTSLLILHVVCRFFPSFALLSHCRSGRSKLCVKKKTFKKLLGPPASFVNRVCRSTVVILAIVAVLAHSFAHLSCAHAVLPVWLVPGLWLWRLDCGAKAYICVFLWSKGWWFIRLLENSVGLIQECRFLSGTVQVSFPQRHRLFILDAKMPAYKAFWWALTESKVV